MPILKQDSVFIKSYNRWTKWFSFPLSRKRWSYRNSKQSRKNWAGLL